MTSTRAINAAAGVILACLQQGKLLPASQAYALDSAGLLNSPEHAAEVAALRARVAELEPYEVLNPQQCPKGLHADWLVDPENTSGCPWCRVAELETLAHGCDGEGCILPHSSWCERAKQAAAENSGCTCPQPWKGTPQPHAGYCWLVSPPRDEVEKLRARVVELEALVGDGSTRTADEDPIAYSLTPDDEWPHALPAGTPRAVDPQPTGEHCGPNEECYGACPACRPAPAMEASRDLPEVTP